MCLTSCSSFVNRFFFFHRPLTKKSDYSFARETDAFYILNQKRHEEVKEEEDKAHQK